MKPLVTIIMPIRNEEDFIERSLGAVLSQTYPHMEVLIADGMSNDETRERITQLTELHHIPVRIIDNPDQIVPTGFNRALKKAQGDIIVRVDGHTIIEPDYVENCVDTLQRTDAQNVGGRMDPVGTNAFGKAVALATSSPFGVGGGRFHYSQEEEYVDTVYMGAWPKSVFDEIGGFDEEFMRNQDDEFNYRLRKNGGKILLSPTIKSTYYNRGSWSKLWKQYYQYGLYKVLVAKKHPGQMRPRQFIPPLFVGTLFAGALLSQVVPLIGILFILEIALYTLVNFAATLITARKHPMLIPLVSLTFATLHIAYGMGFIVGLGRFGMGERG